ncbi:DUF2802 domain-containing protein [Vibrio sp. S4M6]|uniref:DUF2802 domain-containing protein n=1 Tax=Vibrio sinus TaxID=2946865 RepID=UPI002029F192|nr:DUF2802 domain-containing protein [Vibrio sinus]MCL9781825.1 DUF2802 domain-containing protein [Vibrio sinus]
MIMSFITSAPGLAGVAVLVVLLLVLAIYKLKRKLVSVADASRQQVRSLDRELKKSNKQLLEVRSVVVGLGQKVTEQQEIIQHLNERIVELEQDDNDGRLYSRATKMVRLGADVEELIEECELPKAEAELMMSLQKKIAGKEHIPPLESSPEKTSKIRKRAAGRK